MTRNIDLNLCIYVNDLFRGPVILPYILKIICWTNTITGILVPCDAKFYLIKCTWVSDLHFKFVILSYILKTI